MLSHAWWRFTQVCLWIALFVRISVAAPNLHEKTLQKWIEKCNCSCLNSTALLPHNCTAQEELAILHKRDHHLKFINRIPTPPPLNTNRERLVCQEDLKCEKGFKYILLNLSCEGDRTYYVIYRNESRYITKPTTLISRPDRLSLPTHTTKPESTREEKEEENNSEPSKRLVIGLSIGLGLLATIVVCWIAICWRRRRRRRRKTEEEKQDQVHGYIDEEEDSTPYRIVDLQTNISCDASGYTFLDASKKEEEKPYQKLQPKCSRVDTKDCTRKNHPFEDVIEDEPVYFLLEGKGKTNTSR